MVSRRALAPVATCGEATKPGLAPNGSLNQRALMRRVGILPIRIGIPGVIGTIDATPQRKLRRRIVSRSITVRKENL